MYVGHVSGVRFRVGDRLLVLVGNNIFERIGKGEVEECMLLEERGSSMHGKEKPLELPGVAERSVAPCRCQPLPQPREPDKDRHQRGAVGIESGTCARQSVIQHPGQIQGNGY